MIFTLKLPHANLPLMSGRPFAKNPPIFIGSDLHYGHDKAFLYEPRGFDSREAHMKFIRDSFAALPQGSMVVLLGDMFLTCTMDEVRAFLAGIRRDITVFACAGNHNFGIWDLYKETVVATGVYADFVFPLGLEDYPNVVVVPPQFILKCGKFQANCHHFAGLTWDKAHHGRPMFCGHDHGNNPLLNKEDMGVGRILDVGVDNAIKYANSFVFPLDLAAEIVLKKSIRQHGHH